MQAHLFIAQGTRACFGFSMFNLKKKQPTHDNDVKVKHVLTPLLASLPFQNI